MTEPERPASTAAPMGASPRVFPRRRWLLGGLGSAAVLAGAGLAGWRELTSEVQPAPGSLEQPAAAGLWSLSFASPQGGTLSLATWRGRPLLLNFWATWCPPCIEELPLLDRFYQENSANGWQVLGIAVDQQDPVQRFLSRFPLTFPVVLAGFAGMELSKSLGHMSGGLPFTVVLGQDGVVAHRKMGKVSVSDLSAWQRLR